MSATLNATLLYQGLKAQNVFRLSRSTLIFMLKIILSAGVMAFVVNYLSPSLDLWLDMAFFEQVLTLIQCITFGMLSYFISIVILGIRMQDFKIVSQH